MDETASMASDVDESSADELIMQIKKWRSLRRIQYPATIQLAEAVSWQRDSLADCPAKNRNNLTKGKTEDEVMLALEAAQVGTFRWDLRTDRVTWDDALDRLFGLAQSKDSRSKDQLLAHVYPDDRHAIFQRCERCRAYGEDFECDFRVRSVNGSIRWFCSRGKTIFENGTPTYLTGVCFDITKRKTVDMKREAVLREHDRRKDQFLAHMSHEIRSPMASILAYSDILLSRLTDPDDIEYVKTIKRGGNHLLELIEDILDLSKIGSGQLKISREVVSLRTLIDEVHALMEVRAKEKQLPLVLRYEGALTENIETDPTRLRQILFNLVSNAIKFTVEGKVEIIVRIVAAERSLEFEVADTGVGITVEQQDRLFQPFVQADNAKTQGQGTGLGLAITKQLVSALGGEISFESVPNQGSIFRVKIPIGCQQDETASETSSSTKTIGTNRKAKVLLVDDNEMVCKAVGRLLGVSGHEVAVAFDGRSALEKAREFQADVVVLDLRLPDMDGYELLEQLKKLKPFAQTKSIALTGYGEEWRRSNQAVEFDHFLTKPADVKALEKLLLL
jgi:two-component system CheB/CheR fusion protein